VKPIELDLDAIPRATTANQPTKSQTAAWRRVARSLRVDGPQTLAALAANLGYSVEWLRYVTRLWIGWGYVEQVGRTYKLTDKGADFGKRAARRPRTPRPECLVCGRKVTAHRYPHVCTGSRPCSDLVFGTFYKLHPWREGEWSQGAWSEPEWPEAIRLARAKYAADHPTECLRINAVDEEDES
jgi:hypothetical protein